jgi:hypothetical protein
LGNSLGTPIMSDGCYAKMSRFSWRNSTSVLSYLGDRFVPIEVVLAASPTTSSTYFVSTIGLKVGDCSTLPYQKIELLCICAIPWISR